MTRGVKVPVRFVNRVVAKWKLGRKQEERLLVIFPDSSSVAVAEVSCSSSGVTIDNSDVWQADDGCLNVDDPQGFAKWLRSRWQSKEPVSRKVLVVLSQRSVSLDVFDLAGVTPEERKSALTLCIEKIKDGCANECAIAYESIPGTDSFVVLSDRTSRVLRWKGIAKELGLELAGVVVGECLAGYGQSAAPGFQIHVLNGEHCSTFVATMGGVPIGIMDHPCLVPSHQDDRSGAVRSALRLVSSLGPLKAFTPQCEQDSATTAHGERTLTKCLSDVIVEWKPDHGEDVQEGGPRLGMMLTAARCRMSNRDYLNLLTSESKLTASESRFRKYRKAMLLSMIALVSIFSYTMRASAREAAHIRELKEKEAALDVRFQEAEKIQPVLSSLEEWKQADVDMALVLGRFIGTLCGKGEIQLSSLTVQRDLETGHPLIRATGKAASAQEVIRVHQLFLDMPEVYEMRPHSIEPTREDPAYRAAFSMELIVKESQE